MRIRKIKRVAVQVRFETNKIRKFEGNGGKKTGNRKIWKLQRLSSLSRKTHTTAHPVAVPRQCFFLPRSLCAKTSLHTRIPFYCDLAQIQPYAGIFRCAPPILVGCWNTKMTFWCGCILHTCEQMFSLITLTATPRSRISFFLGDTHVTEAQYICSNFFFCPAKAQFLASKFHLL